MDGEAEFGEAGLEDHFGTMFRGEPRGGHLRYCSAYTRGLGDNYGSAVCGSVAGAMPERGLFRGCPGISILLRPSRFSIAAPLVMLTLLCCLTHPAVRLSPFITPPI